MLADREREILVGEVTRIALESTSAEALGAAVMPRLEKLVDASSSVFYRINEHGHMVPLAGTLVEAGYRYSREYYGVDPLQTAMREENPWLFKTTRSPTAWREYLDGPVYGDLCRHYDIHTFLHVRLVDSDHGECGMYGIMLAHGDRQPDFTAQEELLLISLLPTLEAAIRRSARMGSRPALEAALESAPQPIVIMDARGGLVWASRRAVEILGARVPEPLAAAALRLGDLVGGNRAAIRTTVRLSGRAGEAISAELRLARTDAGAPVVVADLEAAAPAMKPAGLAARFGLTPTQAAVLAAIAHGCSDRQIARRRGVSIATVRTHVGQILARLGVRSRVQAALMAAGVKSIDENTET